MKAMKFLDCFEKPHKY